MIRTDIRSYSDHFKQASSLDMFGPIQDAIGIYRPFTAAAILAGHGITNTQRECWGFHGIWTASGIDWESSNGTFRSLVNRREVEVQLETARNKEHI